MSKLFEGVITRIRKLPDEDQDLAAQHLMEYLGETARLSDHISIDEAREAYDQGDFVTIAQWRHELGIGDNQPRGARHAPHSRQ